MRSVERHKMTNNREKPRLKLRAIGLVIRASGLVPWTIVFITLFIICAIVVALLEPNVNGIDNALWFMFQVVTTIGLGDFTATSHVGRAAAVVLSIYSVFYIALLTGTVVSFCTERMRSRRDQSVAHFLDQLEHLSELSHDELADLSERVKHFKPGRQDHLTFTLRKGR